MLQNGNQGPYPQQILLVEDEQTAREALRETLLEAGHHVTAVGIGSKAMDWLERASFDVVVCDLRLPDMDGLTVFRQVKREQPDTDVVLMSAYGSVAETVEAVENNEAHYLAKPFSRDVFVDLIRHIVEHRRLRAELRAAWPHQGASEPVFTSNTPSFIRILEVLPTIAMSNASVLLTGESGTGKELFARAIHHASPRASGPLVAINCAAFPETLFEAELFGHERGAFTGADRARDGRFVAAHGGTLFLDEVVEMPLTAQAKLLRVLAERRIYRLGSNEATPIDVRLISATNRDIRYAIREGRFREDIYHRLKVFHLQVPPLRERRGDLPLLINHFYRRQVGPDAPPIRISPKAWAALKHYEFPGNVRELEHVVEHMLVLSGGEPIELEHLPDELSGEAEALDSSPEPASLKKAVGEFEREYLLRTLNRCGWEKQRTAQTLGISRKTLWSKLKRHHLE